MKVRELIALLSQFEQDDLVVINGKEVTGVESLLGRITTGGFGKQFKQHPRGKSTVVTFTHKVEYADGKTYNSCGWV